MPRSIYRSEAGRAAIRDWCARRLSEALPNGIDIDSSLGTTSVTMVGDGRDVVLLPGTNFATATWIELLALIGRDHRAIGVDIPGQPGLSGPVRPRDVNAYGPWLREVVHTLELERPVIVGHSLSGRAALLAGQGDPSVGGIVLVDPAGLIRLRMGGAGVLATTMHWLVIRDEGSSSALLRRMAAPGSRIRDDLEAWMTLVARHVRSSFAPPKLPQAALAEVQCPVWLVTGRHDPFLPSHRLEQAMRPIAGSTTVRVVDDAGHLLPYEAPQEVLHAVQEVVSVLGSE